MTTKQKQHLLAFLGYYTGQIDGIWGAMSEAATWAFQQDYMEQTDGIFGEKTENQIRQLIGSGETVDHQEDEKPGFWEKIEYFCREEFACKCGKCGGYPAEPQEALIRLAEQTRKHFGNPILVSSGIRCGRHNTAVGGVSNSRHLTGKAMDFRVCGKQAAEVLAYLQQQAGLRYAYAIDEAYVHMDIA